MGLRCAGVGFKLGVPSMVLGGELGVPGLVLGGELGLPGMVLGVKHRLRRFPLDRTRCLCFLVVGCGLGLRRLG